MRTPTVAMVAARVVRHRFLSGCFMYPSPAGVSDCLPVHSPDVRGHHPDCAGLLSALSLAVQMAEHQISPRFGGEAVCFYGRAGIVLSIRAEAVDDRLSVSQAIGDRLIPEVQRNGGQPFLWDL